MADVRHANYDGLKSCARVKQQVTGTRSERLPPPGSMSSSPASLDVDVNSLSTTSSTASSCLPLVPVSCGGSGRAPVSGKKGAAPCGQSRGTSNDIVRSSSAAVSGPDSIITYIDCNSGSQLHRHQPFCSSSQEEAHDGDDEGEDEVTQTSPNSASCLQVRRGSEPVLNAVHRFEADEDLLTANCDNSKRWSTAIAVDSSGRKGCCTQSKRSTESLVSLLLRPVVCTSSPSLLRFITISPNAGPLFLFPQLRSSLIPRSGCRDSCLFAAATVWGRGSLSHDCQGGEVDTSCRLSSLSRTCPPLSCIQVAGKLSTTSFPHYFAVCFSFLSASNI